MVSRKIAGGVTALLLTASMAMSAGAAGSAANAVAAAGTAAIGSSSSSSSTNSSVLSSSTTGSSSSTNASAVSAGSAVSSSVGDVAKLYRIKHELRFGLSGKGGSLDGKPITVDKPIVKSGRVFVPLRVLQQSGIATVSWNAAKREVRVSNASLNRGGYNDFIFRIGSDHAYSPEGKSLPDLTLPAPFLANGRVYFPIKSLSWYGVSSSTAKGIVTCSWSEKFVKLIVPKWETEQAETTFSVLYPKDMYTPYYLMSNGGGGWGGSSGKITAKDILIDGELYNREEFTVSLRPGVNPLQLGGISSAGALFEVTRNVADPSSIPVMIREEGQSNISFTAPASGYVHVKAGAQVKLAGSILQSNGLFDKLTVVANKYVPGDLYNSYKEVSRTAIPIKEQQFSGTITLDKPGTYLIMVLSPAYIPFPELGNVNTEWAEFVVEVE